MIKTVIQISALMLCILFLNEVFLTAKLPDRYEWSGINEIDEEFEKSKNDKRPLIIYFHVDWCGYCRKFNKEFLNDDKVYGYLSQFRMVQINPEDGVRERAVFKQYGGTGYPTFLITYPHNGNKKNIQPFRGGKVQSTDKFISRLQAAIETYR